MLVLRRAAAATAASSDERRDNAQTERRRAASVSWRVLRRTIAGELTREATASPCGSRRGTRSRRGRFSRPRHEPLSACH